MGTEVRQPCLFFVKLLTILTLPLIIMKHLILILLLFGVVAVQAQEKEKQKLQDLLFSGKLKKDSSGIIRKTDDLSAKIDTGTRKEPEPVKAVVPAANKEQVTGVTVARADSNTTVTNNSQSTTGVEVNDAPANAAPRKSNTRLWKEYSDSLLKYLDADILKSKQVKKNIYFLMVDYEIDVDGKVSFLNVVSTPENAFLQAQVRQWMDNTPLMLNPVTDSNNQAKKVKKKQQLTITKE